MKDFAIEAIALQQALKPLSKRLKALTKAMDKAGVGGEFKDGLYPARFAENLHQTIDTEMERIIDSAKSGPATKSQYE